MKSPLHNARTLTAVLWIHFTDEKIISRVFLIVGFLRLPELNPCEFCLWGLLKSHVYRGSTRTIPDLKASITRHVTSLDRETLCATIEHATK